MDKHQFRIPLIPLSIGVLLVLSPILVLLLLFPLMTWLWIGLSIALILYSKFIFVMEIGPDGVRLYRVNMLRWADVRSAINKNILGLRYLRVERHKGINFWIPLYFKGSTEIKPTLREYAPTENPISLCL